jgi:hypothetical protein
MEGLSQQAKEALVGAIAGLEHGIEAARAARCDALIPYYQKKLNDLRRYAGLEAGVPKAEVPKSGIPESMLTQERAEREERIKAVDEQLSQAKGRQAKRLLAKEYTSLRAPLH